MRTHAASETRLGSSELAASESSFRRDSFAFGRGADA